MAKRWRAETRDNRVVVFPTNFWVSVGQATNHAKGSLPSPIRPKTTNSDGSDSDAGRHPGPNLWPR